MDNDYQKAIKKDAELLKKMETASDPVKVARELASHQQAAAALRQGRHFLKIRIQKATDVLKATQTAVDSRFKNEVVKVHAAFQDKMNKTAEAIADEINGYELAIATIVRQDVGVGFLAASKHSKPWLSLCTKALKDYV